MEEVHGKSYAEAHFITYEDPLVEHGPPDGYRQLPNGRVMPIVKKSAGPARDPFKNRGKR
jgi:hypothetical protein